MKVSLVGAGPGDPGLVSIRGMELLGQADVVIYDALVNPAILKYAPENAEFIYVGKVASQHAMPQTQINELLAAKASQGLRVVRLKGGDPYIFGRGGEEGEYLCDRHIPFEEVPGISSAIAAPAYAGIPLTHRDFTSSVSIITGHENPDKNTSAHNWQAMAASGATLVFVMGVRNLPHISKNLTGAGLPPDTPAAIIYRGTTSMQRSLFASIADLPRVAEEAGFSNPSVIVVGKVTELHDKLDWFARKPLLGRRIVVTRAREQASDLSAALHHLGAEILECPTIRIEPLASYDAMDEAMTHLGDYDWIIFTSVNGVKYFWQRLRQANLDARALYHARLAAIGPATARALSDHGLVADLVPDTYVAESVARDLLAMEKDSAVGKRVLLPRALHARSVLPEELARAGMLVDVAPVYEARPAANEGEIVKNLLAENKIDCVTFASSSTARNFLNIVPPELLKRHPTAHLASIGPITSGTLAEYGLLAEIQPASYTIPGLVTAIKEFFAKDHV